MSIGEEELKALRKEVKELRQAIARSPENVDLRLLLISRLLEVDQPQGAWHNCLYVLKKHPNNVPALRLAKKAAETVGAQGRAQEYVRRLTDLLSTGTERRGRGAGLRLIRGGREDGDVADGAEDNAKVRP